MSATDLLYSDPLAAATRAAAELAKRSGIPHHDIALVMGSGWVGAADALGTPTFECDAHELPGFSAPAVEGHSGKVRSYLLSENGKNIRALVFLGRTHLYEGKGVEPVVHGVRTAVQAGCKVVILTNACGGINRDYSVGQPVLIRDHISLTAVSPLSGATFVDLTDLYSKRIRSIMKSADSTLAEGVYVHWRGPTYETPAEIAMMRTMGADLVGMSTVPEAIAAHALGAEVLGISLVTNAAAGITGEKLNHEEVIAAGKAAASRMGTLLKQTIPQLI
jgi:purine-nucleoside phosphorylase